MDWSDSCLEYWELSIGRWSLKAKDVEFCHDRFEFDTLVVVIPT